MPEDWNAHRQALAEAQAWCALKLDLAGPATSLRSAVLEPAHYSQNWEYGEMVPGDVTELIQRRRTLLEPGSQPLRKGRILCVLSGTDTQMGEGVPASDGVIDSSYLPPWDGWFALFPAMAPHMILLAWIPALLNDAVQRAMEVAATEPLIWLDERLPPGPGWNMSWGHLRPEDRGNFETIRRELVSSA